MKGPHYVTYTCCKNKNPDLISLNKILVLPKFRKIKMQFFMLFEIS